MRSQALPPIEIDRRNEGSRRSAHYDVYVCLHVKLHRHKPGNRRHSSIWHCSKQANWTPQILASVKYEKALTGEELKVREIHKVGRSCPRGEFLMAHCPQSQAERCLNKQRLFFPNYHLSRSDFGESHPFKMQLHKLFSQSSSLHH